MAEVLGLAASVSGLLTIADIIVRKGFKFIKDMKDAETSVEKLVEEVNNLSRVLYSLSKIVERLKDDGDAIGPSTQIHSVESCYKTFKRIHDLFDEAMPSMPLSRG